jgi:hypothetical protein
MVISGEDGDEIGEYQLVRRGIVRQHASTIEALPSKKK